MILSLKQVKLHNRNIAFFVVYMYFTSVDIQLEQIKIHHDLDAFSDQAEQLNWYTGTYLSLPRVFMSLVRRKIVRSPLVHSVLIPLHTVCDPVTSRKISINITDRYFFISSKSIIHSEDDLGISQHTGTIMLLRNNDNNRPTMITPSDIKNVIRTQLQQRKRTIQQDVTVFVTEGTFKNWYGVVEEKNDNQENIKVRFNSDDYEYSTNIPSVLCKVAS